MELGTGIFLSAIVITVAVVLFKTRGRWTWKKLFVIPSVVLVLVLVAVILTYIGYQEGYIGPNRIWKETSYVGVKLRTTKADVLFALGKPDDEGELDPNGYQVWTYRRGNENIYVGFGRDGVVATAGAVALNDGDSIPSLKWLNRWTKAEQIEARLGKPSVVFESEGGTRRTYHYPEHNLTIVLSGKGIESLGIRDYAMHPTSFRP